MASRMPCEHDKAATRKLRCQPSSIWLRFFTWMMQPPQSVMQYGITTFCTLPGCIRCSIRHVVVDESVSAGAEDDRLGLGITHGDGGDIEGRRLVALAHVAGPFGVEMVAPLHARVFGFLRFEPAVARMYIAFEH